MKERDAESRLFQPLEGNCNNELKIDCKYVTWGGQGVAQAAADSLQTHRKVKASVTYLVI